MLATLIIVFREILEAALIIGIVAAATRGVPYRGWWVSGGVAVGCIGATLLATAADWLSGLADGVGQEVFNATILFIAVGMLAWHNIWMSSHSRELVAQMKQVGKAVREEGEPLFALALVVGLAVLREGSELVLFLYGQSIQGLALPDMISGGLLGLLAGVAVGAALYVGLLQIPVRHLFAVTGWMILLLAAGMASQAVRFLVQADWLPALGRPWDTSAFLSNTSMTGRLLHALMGYEAAPMGVQLLAYCSTLTVIYLSMRWVQQCDKLALSPPSTQRSHNTKEITP